MIEPCGSLHLSPIFRPSLVSVPVDGGPQIANMVGLSGVWSVSHVHDCQVRKGISVKWRGPDARTHFLQFSFSVKLYGIKRSTALCPRLEVVISS